MNNLTNRELKTMMELSFGRILRLGSRSEQPGDGAEYDKYRNLFMQAADEVKARGLDKTAW
jgi:hypothetical protein